MADSPTMTEDPDATQVRNPARPPRVRVEAAGRTDVGRNRKHNEDQFVVAKLAKSMRICASSLPDEGATEFSDEEGYLLVVADGLGGAAAGEEASRVALRTVEQFVLETVKWFLHVGGHDASITTAELRSAIERADRSIFERAHAEPGLTGMGTTLTMAYAVGADLFIIHAGDSRAYLLRRGELGQITADHTLVQMLVKGGSITPEAARTHVRRNVVTNVIGGPRPGVFAESHKITLADHDVLLLCSDGLTEVVPDASIAAALSSGDEPDAIARDLIERALAAGGPDNVTVVVARFKID